MGMAHGVPFLRSAAFRSTILHMDKQFHDLDIIHDVGINANTIRLTDQKMKHLNSKRPAANRFNETQLTEKLLELIFTMSKHFSE